MIEYIKQNLHWLFSGAGVYILGGVLSILLLFFGLRKIKFLIKFEGHVTNKNS